MRPSLNEIGIACGTDKSTLFHGYLDFYEGLLAGLRDSAFVLYEVGVYHGSSLKMWAQYFENATVVGVDIDAATRAYESGNAHVRIGDAAKLEFLDTLYTEFGRPTVAIDDGSHFWRDQQDTFRFLWPRVRPGGFFIMEDIHTSFNEFSEDFSSQARISTFDYLQNLGRWVVSRGQLGQEKAEDTFIHHYWPTVHSITYFGRTVVIKKRMEAA